MVVLCDRTWSFRLWDTHYAGLQQSLGCRFEEEPGRAGFLVVDCWLIDGRNRFEEMPSSLDSAD